MGLQYLPVSMLYFYWCKCRFGVVNRFEKLPTLQAKLPSDNLRRGILAFLVMGLSMVISLAGLTNIIKYGYGYCGYIGIVLVILPFLTVGVYKNRKYKKAS